MQTQYTVEDKEEEWTVTVWSRPFGESHYKKYEATGKTANEAAGKVFSEIGRNTQPGGWE